MSNPNPKRQPRGIRAGGQYAAEQRGESETMNFQMPANPDDFDEFLLDEDVFEFKQNATIEDKRQMVGMTHEEQTIYARCAMIEPGRMKRAATKHLSEIGYDYYHDSKEPTLRAALYAGADDPYNPVIRPERARLIETYGKGSYREIPSRDVREAMIKGDGQGKQ